MLDQPIPRTPGSPAQREKRGRRRPGRADAAGMAAIVVLAVLSTFVVLLWRPPQARGRTFWLFAEAHRRMYEPLIAGWNAGADTDPSRVRIDMHLLSLPALERRMLASFFAETASADVMEVERKVAGRAFTGPLESVGFADLTERLEREGILGRVNPPSFSPWTNRGRIFGLPHDVHPVLLGYRADLVEAAGIDVSTIETWDDFIRVMSPLMEPDAAGKPKRYLLNMWESNADHLEVLLLQAGGGFFDEKLNVTMDSEVNARVLATVAGWCAGPGRIAADAPNFSLSGNQLKAEGFVVCSFMPDWMCDIWKHEIPTLSGKLKLMPLPAWEKGGRRTSVWGGTMLGIPKTAAKDEADFQKLWEFAKHLYLSDELARELWRRGGIVTPVRSHWSDPIFDEPSEYFSAQPVGRRYIEMAPFIPARSSSPYNTLAMQRMQRALTDLTDEVRAAGGMSQEKRLERARVHLAVAQEQVAALLSRNVFQTQETR